MSTWTAQNRLTGSSKYVTSSRSVVPMPLCPAVLSHEQGGSARYVINEPVPAAVYLTDLDGEQNRVYHPI